MKHFAAASLILILLFASSVGHCLDFKISGQWAASFGYGEHGNMEGSYKGQTQTGWGNGQDNFEAMNKLNLQLEALANEYFSGTLSFETGDIYWGNAEDGGSLGGDGRIAHVKNAYITLTVAQWGLKTRMGMQSIVTPALASGSAVFNDTVEAVVASLLLRNLVTITAFWARPFNDNYTGWHNGSVRGYHSGYRDNVDAFGLFVPVNNEDMNVSPWGMYALIGPNTFRGPVGAGGNPFGNIANTGCDTGNYTSAMLPVAGARHKDFSDANESRKLVNYGNAWWLGLSGSLHYWENFGFAFDFAYGEATYENATRFNRRGWYATLLLENPHDWGVFGIYGWYGSGDDSNPANGSERMPSLAAGNSINYSYFAFDGAPYAPRNALIGNSLAGTLGAGVRVSKLTFIDNLDHSFRVNYIAGSNSPQMAKKMSLAGFWANGSILEPNFVGNDSTLGHSGLYMTSLDYALEFGMNTNYQMTENFTFNFEADYLALYLDTSKSVWGARHRKGEAIPQTKDAWNLNISFILSF